MLKCGRSRKDAACITDARKSSATAGFGASDRRGQIIPGDCPSL
jgi:hypothetical protein